MILQVDDDSPVPPYEQLRGQIATMIVTGVLAAGDRLPTIRQLAADLDLANSTVARAYRELERDQWVITRGRHGTTVKRDRQAPTSDDVEAELERAARGFAIHIAQLGVSPADAIDAVRTAINRTRSAKGLQTHIPPSPSPRNS